MQKIIGLDIGSYSIKAIEITNSFKSYEITNFYEKVIPLSETQTREELLPICMEELFKENNLQADRIVTAMPGQFISSRIVPFNFSDPRKIANAVLYEVEDLVPFNLDEMIVEHQILGSQDDKTMVLAVMTRKNFLASFLDYLERIDIDPKLIDIDSLSLYNLSAHIDHDPNEVYGLVDIGHEKTSVCLVEGEILKMFRTINLGGRYITEFLARDLETTFAEAEKIKHEVNSVTWEENKANSNLSEQELVLGKKVGVAANGFAKELSRTIYAFKIWDKKPISKIYLSGGTSRLKGIENYLEDQLGVPVVKNDLTQTDLKLLPHLAENMEIIPQGIAIGLRAVSSAKRHSTINLRKGEFAYSQDYENILKFSSSFLSWAFVGLLVLVASYAGQYFFYQNQISKLQNQFKAAYLKIKPEAKSRVNKTKQFSRIRRDAIQGLQTAIDDNRIAIDDFTTAMSGSGAIIALKELSTAISKDVKVDVTLYDFVEGDEQSGKVTLKGETDGYAGVATIKEAVSGLPTMEEVTEKSGPKPGTDGKVIEFTINAKYVPQFVGG